MFSFGFVCTEDGAEQETKFDRERKFICFKFKGDMSVEKAFEINQQSSERKLITEALEDLQKDMVELNEVLCLIKTCSVKEMVL
jgi:hypothetical protein